MTRYDVTFTVAVPDPAVLAGSLDVGSLPFAVVCEPWSDTLVLVCTGVEVDGATGPLEAMRKVQASLSPLFRAATEYHRDRGGLLWQDVAAADVRTAAL